MLSVVLALSCMLDKTTQQSLMTTAGSSPSSNDQCVVCCYSNDLTLRSARMSNIMNSVDYVFGLQQIDFAIILKNSQGMTHSSLSQVLEFLRSLITYLEWTGRLIIHPDYARIFIYTFADRATVKMNGISDSTAFYDACELNG